jgi:hypothetical protein
MGDFSVLALLVFAVFVALGVAQPSPSNRIRRSYERIPSGRSQDRIYHACTGPSLVFA